MYLFIKDGDLSERKTLRINKNFVKKIKRAEYRNVLFSEKFVRHKIKEDTKLKP